MNGIVEKFKEFRTLRSQLVKRLDEEIVTMKEILNELNGGSLEQPVKPTRTYVRRSMKGKKKAILGARRWTKQDIDQLMTLVRKRPIPEMKSMSKVLHRTPSAIRTRLFVLKKSGVDVVTNLSAHQQTAKKRFVTIKRHRWSKSEKEKLKRMSSQGLNHKQIADGLGLRDKQVSAMCSDVMRNGTRDAK